MWIIFVELKGSENYIHALTYIILNPNTFNHFLITPVPYITMAEQASPHSTFVEMEVPEVATPNWPPVHRQAPQESYVPTVCQTPSQFIPIVRWQHSSSNLFTVKETSEPIKLCTSSPGIDLISCIDFIFGGPV